MPRIAGVDLPDQKRAEIALRYIYGIGPAIARRILKKSNVNPNKRARDLTGAEAQEITKALSGLRLEGDLRQEIRENIERLKRIGTYRGFRHTHGLPVRGQRTRTNARTKRGKRVTIGAMKKEEATKSAGEKRSK